ncbi:hypothetical protein OG345_41630 (plasmid) [Streptomyces sp. NBC_01220]|uniref:hypothetical protein n=1 Tax=Streptomyces sp. NBC_01220 TaxID=2903781 RepID=UPI002F9151AC|nr:hypothetical protein OG345_41630 [Streptomyces sp. NBC_01220]
MFAVTVCANDTTESTGSGSSSVSTAKPASTGSGSPAARQSGLAGLQAGTGGTSCSPWSMPSRTPIAYSEPYGQDDGIIRAVAKGEAQPAAVGIERHVPGHQAGIADVTLTISQERRSRKRPR